MNKQNINKKGPFGILSKRGDTFKSYAITFLFFLLIIPNLYAENYYVSPNASGTGNGTIGSPWTIYQAAANAHAGDIVFLEKGTYALTSVLNFNQNGTYSNPIIFRGVRVAEDEKTADGTNNTLLRQDNSTTGGQISISGDYVTFENMIIRQQYPKYLLEIGSGANKFTLDSVIVQYPSNVSSSSNHTLLTNADSTTIRYCYFWQGPRTIIWVQNNNGTHCRGFLMEYTTVSNYDNHYAIQCMPTTQIGGDPANYRLEDGIIRNCIFRDSGYESAIYLRNVHNYKVYNNVFINPVQGTPNQYGFINFCANDGIISAPAYDAASVCAFNTMYQTNALGNGQAILHSESNMDGWTFKNNLAYTTSGASVYVAYSSYTTTPSMQNCDIDYNFYYCTTASISTKNVTWTGVNNLTNVTYTWANWKSQRGFDTHTTVDEVPTFTNLSGENFRPSSGSSPQVGKGTDLSSWGITTDYDGNQRDPNNPTIGAFEFSYGGIDITPPNLVGAILNNSTSLTLSFSEQLDSSTAQNINNYSISNGITVSSAVLSGTQVTLTTSAHINGAYTVTVNNVTDIAGNIINPNNNTANYNYSEGDVTPPQVVSATIIDSVTVNVLFSENLEPGSAQNINNYSVTNINITNATLNVNVVTLTTSAHNPGAYSVIVNNVTDLAGNAMDPQHNSAIYEYQPDPNPGLLMFQVSNVLESVVPEPQHYGEKTIDGKGYYDNDPDSRWSGDSMPEWLVYDLGDIQILNVTKLSFYKWDEGRTYNYTLQVSTDSISWTTLRTDIVSLAQEWTQEVVGPIDARYVKIIFVSSNQNSWAGLWESQFWGYLKMPTNLEDEKITPVSFILEQNYPNPFNPSTVIRVHLPKSTQIKLTVYNVLGEFITELTNAQYNSGIYEFNFEATGLASGIYVYRIESPDFFETKKMVLLR